MDVTSYFNKLSFIWQKMDLCRELIWDCPCGGVQYYKIEEVDHVYDFLASLNSKFDAVRGQILGHRSIPTLMEVCSEVHLEEDRSSAMNIITASVTDFVAFSANHLVLLRQAKRETASSV